MIKNIKLEFFKIRHRKVYTTVIAVISATFLWALWAQDSATIYEASQGWMSLIYNFSTINCVIMPILTAIVASRLVDIEHKGNTLKLLKTLQGNSNLFNSKFICGILIMISAVLMQASSMLIIGLINNYDNIPYSYFAYYIFYTLSVTIVLFLIQMILSFQFINQMIAFVIAIAGSFLGLFSLFFGGIISKLIIWSYYGILSPVVLNWDINTRISSYSWSSISLSSLLIIFLAFIFIYVSGKKLFMLKEE